MEAAKTLLRIQKLMAARSQKVPQDALDDPRVAEGLREINQVVMNFSNRVEELSQLAREAIDYVQRLGEELAVSS